MRRENNIYESFKTLAETKQALAEKEAKRIQEAVQKKEDFRNKYNIIKEMKERKDREHGMLMEAARNDALATVVKAIYMTALEAEALTDDGILLAESMVDTWIKESGGASRILGKVGNNSYLLSRITQIVEDAAEAAVEEIEDDSDAPKEEPKEPSTKEKKEEALKATKDFLKDASRQSVNDFIGKVVSSAQTSAVKKAEEKKEEEAAEAEAPAEDAGAEEVKETEPAKEEAPAEDAGTEEPKETEPAEDQSTEAPTDEPEDKSDGEVARDKEAEEKEDPDAKDNAESTEDAAEDDEDIDLDSIPSEDEEESGDDSSDQSTEAPEENGEETSDDSTDEDEGEENTLDDSVSDDEVDDDLGSEPLDDDGEDSDITVDGNTENKGQIFDELEKEDDVQKAIDLIKTRVADAEEQFIRNNAEDKKKMDEVLNKISANVKTVEDLAGKKDKESETKSDIAQEAVRMSKREYDNIVNNRPLTIFEKMTRKLGSGIIKNAAVKESYMNEEGSLDVDHVVESAKVMYGFLETINTLKLENVNSKYITDVLNNID